MTATLPTLNWDLLKDVEEGTEQYGKAIFHINMVFIQHSIRWALERHV